MYDFVWDVPEMYDFVQDEPEMYGFVQDEQEMQDRYGRCRLTGSE
jgi:hypothetical protein